MSSSSRWSAALGVVALLLAVVAQSYLTRGFYRDEVQWLFIAGVAALIGAFPALGWPANPQQTVNDRPSSPSLPDSQSSLWHLLGHVLAWATPLLALFTLLRWFRSQALLPRQVVLLAGGTIVIATVALLLSRARCHTADNQQQTTDSSRLATDHWLLITDNRGLWAGLSLVLVLLAASYWWRGIAPNDAALIWLLSLALFSYTIGYHRRGASSEQGSRGAKEQGSMGGRLQSFLASLTKRLRPSRQTLFDLALLAVILAVAVFMRGYELADLPYGSWYDEAESGLEAVEILNGRPFSPMAKFTFNPSLYFYVLALSFKIFGVSILGIRLVVAAAGVLSCLFLYLLAKRLWGWRVAFVAAILLAVMSWHVTFSRLGMQNVTASLFAIVTLYYLVRALETSRHVDYLWAGLAAGIGVYTYTPFRLVALMMALLLAHEVLSRPGFIRRHFDGLIVMAVAAILAMMPLLIFAVQNPQEFTRRMNETSVFAKKNTEVEKRLALENSLRLHMLMLNVRGDPNGRHGMPGRPMADSVTAAFLVLGLGYSLYRWQDKGYFLAVIWLCIGLLGGIMSLDWEAPQGARTVVAMPAVAMLAAVPLGLVWEAAEDALERKNLVVTTSVVPETAKAATTSGSWTGTTLIQGRHLMALGVVLLLAYVGRLNFNRYFNEQMKSVEVFHAHSARETATARYVNALGPGYWIYLQTANAPIVRLIANRQEDFRFFMPVDHLPLKEHVDRGIVYLFEPWRMAVPVEEFLRYYPDAQVDTVSDPAGEPIFHAVRVDKADVERIFGLTGRYYRGPNWQGQPFLTRTDQGIVFEADWNPLPLEEEGPFSVEWNGTFFAPQPGEYELDLRSQGASWVSVDGQLVAGNRGDPSAGGSGRVTLAKGLHSLEVRLSADNSVGEVALYWTLSGRVPEPIPDNLLFTVPLSDQGLLGRYYRGTDWQGLPQIQEVDRVLSFRWHDVPILGGPWGVEWQGKLLIETPGRYRFSIVTNDRGWLTIDGRPLIEGRGSGSSGDIELAAGEHDIMVRYVDTRGYSEFRLYWELPGAFGCEVIPSAVLSPRIGG
ncbi:MAG: PA14 domain-containing protein [Anaerolineae bacterium]